MPNPSAWFLQVRWASVALAMITIGSPASSLGAGGSETALPVPQEANRPPAENQTTLGLYVTAREAYEKWTAGSGKPIVIDVRTPEEFMFVGHAEMAWNIPLAAQPYEWDAEKRQFPMRLLPDFISRVKQVAKPDDTLLVMCRSGNRSAQAVNLLAEAGFRNVYNITDGMEGDLVQDPNSVFYGQRLVNGWKNSGLPWTYQIDPERMLLPPTR
jgi:rhodanese-related sulfurtransferase